MPIGVTVDLGFDWWISTVAGSVAAVVFIAGFVALRPQAVRGIAGLLALEAIVIAVAAPFVMGDMNASARPPAMTEAASGAMASGDPGSSSTVIHVIEHAPGPDMQTFGVITTFTNPIFNAANTKRIGRDQGFCVRIALAKAEECVWTTILPAGQITTEGPEPESEHPLLFAITGGTGKYQHARGWLEERAHNKAGTEWDEFFHVSG